jgi:hypothetical protein
MKENEGEGEKTQRLRVNNVEVINRHQYTTTAQFSYSSPRIGPSSS